MQGIKGMKFPAFRLKYSVRLRGHLDAITKLPNHLITKFPGASMSFTLQQETYISEINATAKVGEQHLIRLLSSDDGACRIGESHS